MKILLIGYGKMGKTIEKLAKEKGYEIVGALDVDNEHLMDKWLESCDVAIEFTHPNAAFNNVMKCL